MTTGHTSIDKYYQRFFPNSFFRYLYSKVEVQTHEHIVIQYDLHEQSTRPCNIVINSFVYFLTDNPLAFSFNNS